MLRCLTQDKLAKYLDYLTSVDVHRHRHSLLYVNHSASQMQCNLSPRLFAQDLQRMRFHHWITEARRHLKVCDKRAAGGEVKLLIKLVRLHLQAAVRFRLDLLLVSNAYRGLKINMHSC